MSLNDNYDQVILDNIQKTWGGGVEYPFAQSDVFGVLSEWFDPWGMFPFPMGQEDVIWDRRPRDPVSPVVISEVETEILPDGIGPAPVFEEVEIGGVIRQRIPQIYKRDEARPPVLEPIDPEAWNEGFGNVVDDEDENMAWDWGDALSGAIDILQGQRVGMAGPQNFGGGGTVYNPPEAQPLTPVTTGAGVSPGCRYVTYDTKTGKFGKCRRRRRRRLLTPTDLSDLAALAAVAGKGDALKMAVAKAVRR